MKTAIRSFYEKVSHAGARHDEIMRALSSLSVSQAPAPVPAAAPAPAPAAVVSDEPYLEPALQEWRRFYENRREHYEEILRELGQDDDSYTEWYRAGGYGYDPKQSRKWIREETSLADFRGTCLDIGCGDGFWSWILCEWYHVHGIDPLGGTIALAEAVKKRLPRSMKRRVDFETGDALKVSTRYDVVFCRAAGFFNYPFFKEFSVDLMDLDRSRLAEVWRKDNPEDEVQRRLSAYPKPKERGPDWQPNIYANRAREYMERMMSITGKLFVFILSTKPDYYGRYIGDTYNHDPAEVERLFSEFGHCKVRMDSTDTYIVGEIYR